KRQNSCDEKLIGFLFGLECGEEVRGFRRLRVGRKIYEKLLDLPDSLVILPAADIEVDEPEGREIARKAAWKGAPDLFEGFFVGGLTGQLPDACPHVFCLVFGSQGHFIEPRLNGAGRILFLRVELAAQS